MAEPPAKRLDHKMEPDIMGSKGVEAIANHGRNPPCLDIEAVKVELVCNICLDVPSHVATVLPCLHSFCWCCIEEWFKKHRKCPRCAQSASSAKPNAALNNLVQALVEADPTLAKPEELIAQEAEKLSKYKAQKLGTAVLYPYTGYGTEDDDNDSDIEPDDFRHYWPCPCCSPGNRSGYVCANPIPVPAGAVGLAGGPLRGGEWPSIDEAEDFLPFDKVLAHAACEACGSWVPSNGVPEAQCAGCEAFNCSPYDSEGLCPAEDVHTKVDSHFTVSDPVLAAALRTGGFTPTESGRIQKYMQDNNISVQDIVTAACVQARELVASKDFQMDELQTEEAVKDVAGEPQAQAEPRAETQDQEAPQAQAEAEPQAQAEAEPQAQAEAEPQAEAPAAAYKAEAVLCLIMAMHSRECRSPLCHTLDIDRAVVLLNAYFCLGCARHAAARLVAWWWRDIRENQRDKIPETILNLPDCPHGEKCTNQWDDDAHARAFNHFCKEKTLDQPQDANVPAAGEPEQA
ncbi:hypothetical protein BCV69DRAFT_108150 [Microstroma glucosiphilum]|uniref:RING-type domain-containing protein n=1 Tax=Pseudomicrostroma glucosiphilum TaxID=1684307 RepID=A0A316UD33_9BASI|nr:hypothetical protein BCV69DRAFT_108150 [Pseudomicrostroma glucosiphilum]PWN23109.1 hypothetical protein BCV69DRAFT_108150 [Pseudomicrostroma glucosiphilum]